MQNLNQRILREMPVGVPPLAEQHRIVAKVAELLALCDEMETELGKTGSIQSNYLGETVHRALNGTENPIRGTDGQVMEHWPAK